MVALEVSALSAVVRSSLGARDQRDACRDISANEFSSKQLTVGPLTKEEIVADPTQTDPDKYKVVLENDLVRVLEYKDVPGQRTSPHDHPASVMVTLSGFERRLIGEAGDTRDVTLEPGLVRWLDAQTHSGENIGSTPTHVVFVELKEALEREEAARLGPSAN